jgi:3D-(3,5/4)-trihydroxycyclohexane-1,2-dione acylhydrolase (decyclizing)
MGYEVAGGLGVKLAAPEREVFVMVGDGSWLMMSSEIVTAVEQGLKLVVVLIDNSGFASIGGLSESVGGAGFGTRYAAAVDFEQNARSLGAVSVRVATIAELRTALAEARRESRTSVIVIRTDREARVGGYESWWDVPPAQVSDDEGVRKARAAYDTARRKQRWYL